MTMLTIELTASQSLIEVARIFAGLAQNGVQMNTPQPEQSAPKAEQSVPQVAQSVPQVAAPAQETKTYTAEEMRKIVAPFIQKNRQGVIDLLKNYKAQSITALQPEQYNAFIADLKTL